MPARAREEREAGGDIIISVVVRGVRACRAQAEDTLVLVHRSSHAREKVARVRCALDGARSPLVALAS